MVPVALFLGWDVMRLLRRLPLAVSVACIYSGAIAILILAAPRWQLERFLLDLRIGEILPVFAPPLSRGALSLLVAVTAGLVGWCLFIGLSRMLPAKPEPGLQLPQMPPSGLLDQLPRRTPPRILPPRQIRPAPFHRQTGSDLPGRPEALRASVHAKRKAAAHADDGLMLHLEPAPVKPPE